MDLRRLRLFLAVVDEGGFTAAARAVHVAQPAVSLAVRELEEELGAPAPRPLPPRRHPHPRRRGPRAAGPPGAARRRHRRRRGGRGDRAGGGPPRRRLAAHDGRRSRWPTWWGAFRRAHPAVQVRLAAPERPRGGGRRRPLRSGRGRASPRRARPTGTCASTRSSSRSSSPCRRQGRPPAPVRSRCARSRASRSCSARRARRCGRSSRPARPRPGSRSPSRWSPSSATRSSRWCWRAPGTSFLPAALARSAEGLGAVVRRTQPALRRTIALVHRPGALSPAARAFLAAAGIEPDVIRPPAPDELERLQEIEVVAGRAFVDVGMPEIASDEPLAARRPRGLPGGGRTWVAGGRGRRSWATSSSTWSTATPTSSR